MTLGAQPDAAFDLGPAPERVTVEVEQVRRLLCEQLPQWADLPVRPVEDPGWDNWTFHLGIDKLVRMPSAAAYALAVDKERQWLPVLAAHLPLPVPVALAHGRPGADYPFDWTVYPWLEGETITEAPPADPVRLALDLAELLTALGEIDTAGGPPPGLHNWFRGGPLRTYDPLARDALADLEGQLDLGVAAELWSSALTTPWDGAVQWFHGDLAPGNLLTRNGRLAAVIDFGTCGVGDPACDLAAAWTLLNAEARQVLRDSLAVDDATWERGRGWALWKTLATCAATIGDVEDAEEFARARHVLDEILERGDVEPGGHADMQVDRSRRREHS